MDTVEPDRYAIARRKINAQTFTAARREMAWAALAAAATVYAAANSWDTRHQTAALKLEAVKCEPLVLDKDGHTLSAAPLNKLEESQVDNMVVSRLSDTVRRLRGVDPSPKVVAKNWAVETPLFETEDAYRKLNDYRRAAGLDTVPHLQARQAAETVEVEAIAWGKSAPKAAPGRYWLRWTETHRRSNGSAMPPEYWSGEFDVALRTPDPKIGDWNPIRYQSFDWHRDLVQ